jgi:hypothetical protein
VIAGVASLGSAMTRTSCSARLIVAIALCAGCAATRSGPSAKQLEYLKVHPLSPDEERRLYAREAMRGDTLDRVRVTFDDCDWEKTRSDGSLTIWSVHVHIDARPIRITTDKLEEVPAGGNVLLTFDRDLLQSALIL